MTTHELETRLKDESRKVLYRKGLSKKNMVDIAKAAGLPIDQKAKKDIIYSELAQYINLNKSYALEAAEELTRAIQNISYSKYSPLWQLVSNGVYSCEHSSGFSFLQENVINAKNEVSHVIHVYLGEFFILTYKVQQD